MIEVDTLLSMLHNNQFNNNILIVLDPGICAPCPDEISAILIMQYEILV